MGYTKMCTSATLSSGDSIFVNKDANEITEEFNSVNRPAHYTEGRKYEPIDVIEDWNLGFLQLLTPSNYQLYIFQYTPQYDLLSLAHNLMLLHQ